MRYSSHNSCNRFLTKKWRNKESSHAISLLETHPKLPQKHNRLLNPIISALGKNGKSQAVILLYKQLRQSRFEPSVYSFAALLNACARKEALSLGKVIHAEILNSHLQSDVLIGNALIHMYSKCGRLDSARHIFLNLTKRDIVSWNIMMAGFVQNGCSQEALLLFQHMEGQGFKPDRVSYLAVLKACSNVGALEQGKRIHAKLIESGCDSDVFLGSALIDMYAKCGSIDEARQVFSNLPERDVVSWTSVISGFTQQGRGEEALHLFQEMRKEGIKPNKVTFICALKACSGTGALDQGEEIHKMLSEYGMKCDLSIGTSLVHMYAKCGSISKALHVFFKLPQRDVFSWTALISGLIDNGQSSYALQLFEKMQNEAVVPNRVTYLCVLKACGSIKALDKGQFIHLQLMRNGLIHDLSVANTLLSMYVKCGNMDKARQVFSESQRHNLVAWNAMIDGYAEHQNGLQALRLFEEMQKQGVKPDKVTFLSVLKACRNIGALDKGRYIHAKIISSDLKIDGSVGNILVDMYCKCGRLDDACEVFWKLPERDAVSWNTLLDAFAQQGNVKEAFHLFEKMQLENVKPDKVSFVCLLKACSNAGLLDEGYFLFESMHNNYGVLPEMEHYTCMVDLLGRSGDLYKAADFISKMPIQPDAAMWMSLLGACQTHGNLELGQDAFESVLKLEPRNAAAYAMMSNIYAAARMRSHEAGLRTDLTYL
ncbi:hypothetical protein O6H91_06G122700 [Diphasiastrum complanatum]|uniref:Uncharacterized protein n=3 Tax=Diphasiastrum complanatum TaxID=34168 RepID=A0ACC2DIM5_DIPCM|nr:hypothetical protein O6H91_06G122000 [Diphasiastrum complanatum]KAJ7553995.1 hypothetical protein O6H91_06G122000 [Diphasiastrum complanatum]KAJ7554019.1 hypothetical protein O6H91_06G122700 [Diphasiastrum complanatum]